MSGDESCRLIDPQSRSRAHRPCGADTACPNPSVKRGMCNTHYQQWRARTPSAQRQRPTTEQRFLSKVNKLGPDDCWPWTGGISDTGYGVFKPSGRPTVSAHRFAFEQANGYPAEHVDHTCHNGSGCDGGSSCLHRRCCNPAHLESTSNLVNSLRGESVAARHARKTHCVHGHEFSPENTYIHTQPNGRPHRLCRTCQRNRNRVIDQARRDRRRNSISR